MHDTSNNLLSDSEIIHHQKIEEIQSELFSSLRKLVITHDPHLVAEALEGFVNRLQNSKRKTSHSENT